jgi:hypothetical protein
MRKLSLAIIVSVLFLTLGCGGKKSNPKPAAAGPSAASLSLPAQNAVCITGTELNALQSSVQFVWNTSANTDSYDLTIKNLLTSESTTETYTANQATVTLSQNTPYAWFVTSKSASSSSTAQSATSKFYNSGTGVVSYAPFPAAIVSPYFAQNVTAINNSVNLTWTGSSTVKDAMLTYSIYFGSTSTPPLLKDSITDSFLNNVVVAAKTTYYWKVITTDAAGNTSDSGMYQFSVD